MTIRTNRQWREFVYRDDVPKKVLEDQFDWMKKCIRHDSWKDCNESKLHIENARKLGSCIKEWPDDDYIDGFFRYHGIWYHLCEFDRVHQGGELAGWHGAKGDSFFSGVVIRLSDGGEQFQIGTYIS